LKDFFEFFIAWRIVRSRKRRSISVITFISVLGIVLGVTALVSVLSITGGFQDAFRDRILGLHPHLVVLKQPAAHFDGYRRAAHAIRAVEGVAGASPSTYGEMLAAHGSERLGIAVKGVDPVSVESVSPIREHLLEGAVEDLDERPKLRLEGSFVHVDGVVHGSSWTIASLSTSEGVRLIAAPDVVAPPGLGKTRVRLMHLVPDAPPMALEIAEHAPAVVESGETSRGIEVLEGEHTVILRSDSGMEVLRHVIEARASTSVALALLPGANGGYRLETLEDAPGFRGEMTRTNEGRFIGTGRVRLLTPSDLNHRLPGGELGSGYVEVPGRLPTILLGWELMERLEVEVGDALSLVSPLRGIDNRMLGPHGLAPSGGLFEVKGAFRSGFHDYDVRLGLIHYRAAQRLIHRGDVVQWVEVRFDDVLDVKAGSERVRGVLDSYTLPTFLGATAAVNKELQRIASGEHGGKPLEKPGSVIGLLDNVVQTMEMLGSRDLSLGYAPSYKLIDWEEMNHNLFGALKLQKVVLTIFFLIILAVAAFNVVGSQIMIVHDKRANIAILKAMGARNGSVLGVFVLQGFFVAMVGTVIGLFLGLGACLLVDFVGYPLDPEVYLIDTLPVRVEFLSASGVAALVLLFTTLATLYSARRAALLPPVQGLRQLD
jgi:ABC-type lipoprotein release transport system permease subunit